MSTMQEAMLKAGLMTQADVDEAEQHIAGTKDKKKKKSRRKEKATRKAHRDWVESNFMNRFDDIALFEIWMTSGEVPSDYLKICALCGKRECEFTVWECPCQGRYNICGECFSAESRRP